MQRAFGAASVVAPPGSPRTVEELRVFHGRVYAAAGADGIVASTGRGTTWSRLGGPSLPVGHVWESRAVTGAPDAPVIYAGSTSTGRARAPIVRSTNGGRRFQVLTRRASSHEDLGGPGGSRWRLASRRAQMPGGGGTSQRTSPCHQRIRSAHSLWARAGIWCRVLSSAT